MIKIRKSSIFPAQLAGAIVFGAIGLANVFVILATMPSATDAGAVPFVVAPLMAISFGWLFGKYYANAGTSNNRLLDYAVFLTISVALSSLCIIATAILSSIFATILNADGTGWTLWIILIGTFFIAYRFFEIILITTCLGGLVMYAFNRRNHHPYRGV